MSAEERRLSILRAAVPLFAQNGFNGTTTKQIAKAASVSEALLYKHFPSKEAIYSELEEICLPKREISEVIANLVPGTQTLVGAIYFLISMIYKGDPHPRRDGVTHDHLHRLMMNSYLEDGAFARIFLDHNIKYWQPIFQNCIDAAVASGDMLSDWIKPEARWWLAHHIGVAIGFLNLPENQVIRYGFPIDQLLDQSVRFSLRGMGLTDEAIKTYYDPEKLAEFHNSLFK